VTFRALSAVQFRNTNSVFVEGVIVGQCPCKQYVTPPFMPLLFSEVRSSPQSAQRRFGTCTVPSVTSERKIFTINFQFTQVKN
jgi:hypothetical protein